jgi:hypothetical protein
MKSKRKGGNRKPDGLPESRNPLIQAPPEPLTLVPPHTNKVWPVM